MIISKNNFGTVTSCRLAESNDQEQSDDKLLISHKNCEASISLFGGHVLTWQPVNEKPVFWMSKSAIFNGEKPIRGGIPLCWPWFGPKFVEDKDNKVNVGNHGFARIRQWSIDSVDVSKESVCIVLLLSGEKEHTSWPSPYRLKQTLTFGKTFTQELAIENCSDIDFDFTGALHSYFQISEPKSNTIEQLSAAPFDNKLTEEKRQVLAFDNCCGPKDRIYYCDDTCEIVDEKWQRRLVVSSTHCKQWVMWNPGYDIAQTMKDIHQGGELEFVCLEAANTEVQTVKAQHTYTMSQTVRVERF